MPQFVLISGCSGGGKSTLLCELRRRGCRCVEEPGRRIIAAELETGGSALPWVDPVAFAERAVAMALADRVAAESSERPSSDRPVFFDRGLVDAAAALEHASGRPILRQFANGRYYDRVFLAPPWPEIYRQDEGRKHAFAEATAEYGRLLQACAWLGYPTEMLPKASVAERADFVLARVASAASG